MELKNDEKREHCWTWLWLKGKTLTPLDVEKENNNHFVPSHNARFNHDIKTDALKREIIFMFSHRYVAREFTTPNVETWMPKIKKY